MVLEQVPQRASSVRYSRVYQDVARQSHIWPEFWCCSCFKLGIKIDDPWRSHTILLWIVLNFVSQNPAFRSVSLQWCCECPYWYWPMIPMIFSEKVFFTASRSQRLYWNEYINSFSVKILYKHFILFSVCVCYSAFLSCLLMPHFMSFWATVWELPLSFWDYFCRLSILGLISSNSLCKDG